MTVSSSPAAWLIGRIKPFAQHRLRWFAAFGLLWCAAPCWAQDPAPCTSAVLVFAGDQDADHASGRARAGVNGFILLGLYGPEIIKDDYFTADSELTEGNFNAGGTAGGSVKVEYGGAEAISSAQSLFAALMTPPPAVGPSVFASASGGVAHSQSNKNQDPFSGLAEGSADSDAEVDGLWEVVCCPDDPLCVPSDPVGVTSVIDASITGDASGSVDVVAGWAWLSVSGSPGNWYGFAYDPSPGLGRGALIEINQTGESFSFVMTPTYAVPCGTVFEVSASQDHSTEGRSHGNPYGNDSGTGEASAFGSVSLGTVKCECDGEDDPPGEEDDPPGGERPDEPEPPRPPGGGRR